MPTTCRTAAVMLAAPLLVAAAGSAARGAQPASADAADAPIVLENAAVRLVIGPDARVQEFTDRAGGANRLAPGGDHAFASIRTATQTIAATAARREGDATRIEFGAAGPVARLKGTARERYLIVEVLGVDGADVRQLTFAHVPLALTGAPSEPFAACALAMNLRTNVQEIPGAMSRLHATADARFGFAGAAVAILGCPRAELRDVMKQAVSDAPELPHSSIGGPWALDSPANRDSYLMDLKGEVNEQTVDTWIALAKNLGIRQLDFHTGHSFFFGDYEANPAVFPRGRAGAKAVIDKLHAAGLLAGLHTYAFFVGDRSRFVRPKPDPRLACDASFTLADDLTAEATTVPVVESTADVSTITGFFIRNSVTLRIDDELIDFKSVSKTSPFAFTGCVRGARGTKAAAHARGAKAGHLKQCFGLFVPDAETMLADVAQCTADTYNDCGFDMIYLDALDGEGILAGDDVGWHYGSKFTFELARRLRRPALMEMSTFHHHLWYVRSRMGAWDVPSRGVKRFIDMHVLANRGCAAMFLPSQLGWWGIWPWSGVQPERSFPDDIEYLCGKCLGYDSGVALLVGFSPDDYRTSANTRRLGAMIRRYEELRHSGAVSEAMRERLRVLGDEYTLEDAGDAPRFRPVDYLRHKVQGIDGPRERWTVANRFAEQPLAVRVEAMQVAEPYDAPDSPVVAEFASTDEFPESKSQDGVRGEFSVSRSEDGRPIATFSAENTRPSRQASWTMRGKTFSPFLNLGNRGLGLWVHGDGKGEVLNVQLIAARQHYGGVANHVVPIDFSGWRYVELVEPTTHDLGRYDWPFFPLRADWPRLDPGMMGFAYPNLHIQVMYEHIEKLGLWLNHVPVGERVECKIRPIRSLRLKSAAIRNPSIAVNGRTLTFPVELATGSYLEFHAPGPAVVYDAKGEKVSDVTPTGDVPTLSAGDNVVDFACENAPTPRPRAVVTLMPRGDAVR